MLKERAAVTRIVTFQYYNIKCALIKMAAVTVLQKLKPEHPGVPLLGFRTLWPRFCTVGESREGAAIFL